MNEQKAIEIVLAKIKEVLGHRWFEVFGGIKKY